MHTLIENITYGLIATSCTVLFVCGSLAQLWGAIIILQSRSCWPPKWSELAQGFGAWLLGLAAVAIALHFTL